MVLIAKKKGQLVWGALLKVIVGIVILFFILKFSYDGLNTLRSSQEKDVQRRTNITGEFIPYQLDEADIATNSMKGLVSAINAVAKGEDVNKFSEKKIDSEKLGFEEYEISFSSSPELVEDGWDDYRDWMFSKTFKVNKKLDKIDKVSEDYVFADFYDGSCTDDNEGNWVDCNSGYPKTIDSSGECYCRDEDDEFDAYKELKDQEINSELIEAARKNSLAAVTDLTPIYNLKLETFKDGKVACSASTSTTGKITDTDENRLYLWGYHNNPLCEPDGCDRNKDGVQGSYGPDFYGKPWKEVVPKEYQKQVEARGDVKRFFPDGKIQSTEGNGQYCADSPNWIECPGVRIYYCSRLTSKTGVKQDAPEKQYYRLNKDKEITARAGIMVYRVFDERFTGHISPTSGKTGFNSLDCYFYPLTDSPYDECNLPKIVEIRGTNWEYYKTWIKGVWDTIVSLDLDILIGSILGNVFSFGNPVGTYAGAAAALEMKGMDDPDVFCQNGLEFGKTAVKCTNTIDGGCGVCDFHLPQNVPDDNIFEWSLDWFGGFGDPNYVIYYEAFPPGEDEAWHVAPMDIGLASIVAFNVGAPIGGAVVKNVVKLTAAIAKPLSYRLISGASWVFVKQVKRLIPAGKAGLKVGGEAGEEAATKIAKEVYQKVLTEGGTETAALAAGGAILEAGKKAGRKAGLAAATETVTEEAIRKLAKESGEKAYQEAIELGFDTAAAVRFKEAANKATNLALSKTKKKVIAEEIAKQAGAQAGVKAAAKAVRKQQPLATRMVNTLNALTIKPIQEGVEKGVKQYKFIKDIP
ncbi:hypothetical protein ACFLYT_00515, partial [Nanoarchaeota archaeon]